LKSKIFTAIFFLILFSLVACSPSEEAIQVALGQTQTAQITNTNTPEPTLTFTLEPTFTPTFTLTPTFTPTLTSTPDTRVIMVDSRELMLAKEDLPPEAKCYLPNQFWISPLHNSEIVSVWGTGLGTKYVEETGRIDGWYIYYRRGSKSIRTPEQIYQNISQFETAEGAKLAMTMDNPNITVQYTILDDNYDLGDQTIISVYKEMQSNGENRVTYKVDTVYRNYKSRIIGWGWEKEFDLEDVISIAEMALEKIKAAPLGSW
jgi:hypothetical protein